MDRVILTPTRMGESDRRTIAAGTPSLELMERAGWLCHSEAVRLAGGIGRARFVVLVGPGNNGGDGFVVARLIADRGGWVRCVLVGDRSRVSGDAETNLRRFNAIGGDIADFDGSLPDADVYIDALFGTGFRGALRGSAAEAVTLLGARGAKVLAVDIPSGVNGLNGAIEGPAVRADTTVTMQAVKPGLVLEPGAQNTGKLVVAEIGVEMSSPDAMYVDPNVAAAKLPPRGDATHKWAVGSVLAIGGSVGMSGAPTMVSEAAFAAGAGLVVCAAPAPIQPLIATALVEVMTIAAPCEDGKFTEAVLDAIPNSERYSAVAFGPGIGHSPGVTSAVHRILNDVEATLILDADGLNAIHGRDLTKRTAPTVVTPHEGEFKRLGGSLDGARNRIDAVVEVAEAWQVTVLLKGVTTIVATPGRPASLCRNGGPELATAGSGDTLTGAIAAYVARGLDLHDAAVAGACIHGAAGRLAAESGRWIVAGDIGAELGRAERMLAGA